MKIFGIHSALYNKSTQKTDFVQNQTNSISNNTGANTQATDRFVLSKNPSISFGSNRQLYPAISATIETINDFQKLQEQSISEIKKVVDEFNSIPLKALKPLAPNENPIEENITAQKRGTGLIMKETDPNDGKIKTKTEYTLNARNKYILDNVTEYEDGKKSKSMTVQYELGEKAPMIEQYGFGKDGAPQYRIFQHGDEKEKYFKLELLGKGGSQRAFGSYVNNEMIFLTISKNLNPAGLEFVPRTRFNDSETYKIKKDNCVIEYQKCPVNKNQQDHYNVLTYSADALNVKGTMYVNKENEALCWFADADVNGTDLTFMPDPERIDECNSIDMKLCVLGEEDVTKSNEELPFVTEIKGFNKEKLFNEINNLRPEILFNKEHRADMINFGTGLI